MLYLKKSNGNKVKNMEEQKIYVVMNINRFKGLCLEKLGDEITADDFIDMESFKSEKVHLIPHPLPNNYLVGPNIRNYDIYINLQEKWQEKNIVNITNSDIEELLEDDALEDIETYEKWKETLCFKVDKKECFYDKIFPLLSDTEAISLIKTLTRTHKINVEYNFYIVYEEDTANIYIHNSFINTVYKFPFTTLDKDELSDLIKDEIVSNCECKINEESESIKLDNKLSNIGPERGFLRDIRILKTQDYYMIREPFRNSYREDYRPVIVKGSTAKDVIYAYRRKLTEFFFSRDRLFGHKDFSKTYDIYKHLIDRSKDIEY